MSILNVEKKRYEENDKKHHPTDADKTFMLIPQTATDAKKGMMTLVVRLDVLIKDPS